MRNLSPGTLILGIFAVLFGLVAAYAAKSYLQEKEAQAATGPAMVNVPMAVADLPAERIVTKDDIMVIPLTQKQLEEYDQYIPYMMRSHEIVGRTLSKPMARGSVFQIANLYPVGVGPNLADRLEEGERAVTIPFTGSIAKTGLVKPGSIVDVLFRTQEDGGEALGETTLTLLEKVRVLAVGQQTFEHAVGTGDTGGTVTLAVTALQARALKVVEDRGSLTLVLRNGDDSLAAGMSGPTTLEELLGKRSNRPFTTQVYKRGRLITVIHEGDQPTYIQQETPYGMPVVGQVPAASDQTSLPPNDPASIAAGNAQWGGAAGGNHGRPAGPVPARTERATADIRF